MIDFTKLFFIYGLGVSGKSVVKFLRNYNCSFSAIDDNKLKNKFLLKNEYCQINNLTKILNKSSYIVVSPSIDIDVHPVLSKFKDKVITDIDILGSLIPDKVKVIAITGTEGKSSVCNYLDEVLNKKFKSILLGNIGRTILHKKNIKNIILNYDYMIFELSSYQLDKIKYLKINIGCITNLYPDHLIYHKTYRNYIKSKLSISNLLKKKGIIFINKNTSNEILNNKLSLNNNFKIYKTKKFINDNDSFFINENVSSLYSITSYLKFSFKISDILKINNLPFRNQIIYNKNNLKILNDSKSTNLLNSINTFNSIKIKNKILILGGKLKNNDIDIPRILNSTILIFGNDKDHFLHKLQNTNSKVIRFLNLESLIIFLSFFINLDNNNKIILFSPGGESFDTYSDFIERGNHFNYLVKKYINA